MCGAEPKLTPQGPHRGLQVGLGWSQWMGGALTHICGALIPTYGP